MHHRQLISAVLLLLAAAPISAGELVLPVFAYNLEGRSDDLWNSEIYLTNPGDQPVQVELARFLPGEIAKPTPCDLFMPPTRVVPPHSAAVWTASGLATDLGCAESARGGLVLKADGPIHISSRLVHLADSSHNDVSTVLSGFGEAIKAIPIDELPAAGSHLLPSLMWHRNPCDGAAYDTFIGFANPGPGRVEVLIDLPESSEREMVINGEQVFLPHRIAVPHHSWKQMRLAPVEEDGAACGGIESFVVRVETNSELAFYASVIDRKSGDPRTVYPVPLRPE